MTTTTQTLKVLGQLAPAAATLSTLYTVPAATTAVISAIMAANTSNTTDFFQISIAIGGASDAVAQYIYKNILVPGGQSFAATLGVTLGAGDVVRCYSTNGSISFNLFGAENS